MDKDEVKEIYPNIEKISTYSTEPDDCEPNDTIVTAYPYSKVPVVTSKVTSKNDFYSLGMKHAGLHSKEDEDWFYTELQSGQEYFVDLRNVGKTNWFISLYYFNEDGTGYYYTTDPSQKSVYEKNQKNIFTLQQKIQENIISGSVMEMIGKTICIIFLCRTINSVF